MSAATVHQFPGAQSVEKHQAQALERLPLVADQLVDARARREQAARELRKAQLDIEALKQDLDQCMRRVGTAALVGPWLFEPGKEPRRVAVLRG